MVPEKSAKPPSHECATGPSIQEHSRGAWNSFQCNVADIPGGASGVRTSNYNAPRVHRRYQHGSMALQDCHSSVLTACLAPEGGGCGAWNTSVCKESWVGHPTPSPWVWRIRNISCSNSGGSSSLARADWWISRASKLASCRPPCGLLVLCNHHSRALSGSSPALPFELNPHPPKSNLLTTICFHKVTTSSKNGGSAYPSKWPGPATDNSPQKHMSRLSSRGYCTSGTVAKRWWCRCHRSGM